MVWFIESVQSEILIGGTSVLFTDPPRNYTEGTYMSAMDISQRIKDCFKSWLAYQSYKCRWVLEAPDISFWKLKEFSKIFQKLKYVCMLCGMTGTSGRWKQIGIIWLKHANPLVWSFKFLIAHSQRHLENTWFITLAFGWNTGWKETDRLLCATH